MGLVDKDSWQPRSDNFNIFTNYSPVFKSPHHAQNLINNNLHIKTYEFRLAYCLK